MSTHPPLDPSAWIQSLAKTEEAISRSFQPFKTSLTPPGAAMRMEQGFRCLLAIYASKSLALCRALRRVLEERDYFLYAMVGRSILEHFAILIYYGREKIEPLLGPEKTLLTLSPEEIQTITEALHAFTGGRRYDWRPILNDILPIAAQSNDPKPSQVNILTCLQKWARRRPEIEDLYALFCDMVHPNAGSLVSLLRLEGSTLIIGEPQEGTLIERVVARTAHHLVELLATIPGVLNQLEQAAQQSAELERHLAEGVREPARECPGG